ncbi:ABC-2 type transport system permease protein [Anseongella ginsenosidimutans]|uniref:ABC-2 type transport system permease protein n=1 Tax=Anseongella ginsenosidimutans TaxID=496056 RepID=A0A4R3KMS9_9SPHI|nr:ABC transporter permease [Anseongella ginsenosidimutans]QEC53783.1 ABC transporter permease [Anseongella ginsenosidimutans]TCS84924.1 ABC-2 type transport system permease protein [Anseongella ginsenosidimutans]
MDLTTYITAISRKAEKINDHPFWVIVSKEISDHVRSWRFIILIGLIALTCLGSLYTALTNIGEAVKPNDPEGAFFFLKLFTITDGTLPSYVVFVGFLGPLLGIGLGFDAVNSEQNKGTLSRIMSQPIHRDYLLNAKFVAALVVISVLFFALAFLVTGLGMITIGIPPAPGEFMRILVFILLSILYVAFWLNLSILFSVRFRQAATSALSAIAVWVFFSVFYGMIVNVIARVIQPGAMAGPGKMLAHQKFILFLQDLSPSQLFSDATLTLLMPSVRSLGPLTRAQVVGAIPSPLPLGQSLLLVWPQLTGLIAVTVICFALSYVYFMKKEIRSR